MQGRCAFSQLAMTIELHGHARPSAGNQWERAPRTKVNRRRWMSVHAHKAVNRWAVLDRRIQSES